jgi:hypothetical protein
VTKKVNGGMKVLQTFSGAIVAGSNESERAKRLIEFSCVLARTRGNPQ